jgi:hypothetical protein
VVGGVGVTGGVTGCVVVSSFLQLLASSKKTSASSWAGKRKRVGKSIKTKS